MFSGFRPFLAAAIVAVSTYAFAGGTGHVDFVDGVEGNYTISTTHGAPGQILGQVQAANVANLPTVTGMTINLGGTSRSGLTNLRLWYSIIPSLSGATQFGSTVAADPGASSMTFTGSASIFASQYFMLAGDLASNSTGTISPHVMSVTVGGGDLLSGFGGNDPMANSDPVFLPVTLSRFEIE